MYIIATMDDKTIAMTLCGVGIVNAALTTQNMIDVFPKTQLIIFSGIAGGINPAYRIGDVVIPTKWANLHHQKYVRPLFNGAEEPTQTYADFGVDFPNPFYLVDGEATGLTRSTAKDFCTRQLATASDLMTYLETGAAVVPGFSVPMHVEVVQYPDQFYEPVVPSKFWFEVDPDMLGIVQEVIEEGLLLKSEGLDHDPIVNVSFAGASSDTFVDNADYREEIFRLFEVDIVDMESAAFMHVCATNQKQCLVLRSVSDLAGGNDEGNQIGTFLGLAAENSATVLDAFLSKL
eukprot:TRINITY_DN8657_c1_g5_i1.p1 TRINITY_DN8657_c1_g5~~TRINITY_DN8657_c1_g5_i1.p1  ORF type:complete len:290 (-),score=31.57 TRINITY_DN8657_c1_g5_i1:171-1040(-)